MSKTRDKYSENLENQYRRLERKYSEIVQNFSKNVSSKSSEAILDSIHDFFVICYHLRDWIKKDSKITEDIKDKLPSFEDDNIEPNNPKIGLQICRDLCNIFKHRKLDKKRRPNDINTKIDKVGGALFKISFHELELARKEKKTIHLKEKDTIYMGNFTVSFKGNRYELRGVVESCMHFWKNFFKENNLLIPRSTPYNK